MRIARGRPNGRFKKAAELLKIKPGHPRYKRSRRNTPATATGWPRLRPLAASHTGVVAGRLDPLERLGLRPGRMAVMTAVIVIYLNKTALVIDVRDTGIKVEVLAQGSAVTITGPNNERIEVTPGEQHLKIEYAGLETVTTSFELKKGQRRRIKVSLVDRKLVAELENLPLTLTPPPEGIKQKVASPLAAELQKPALKLTPKTEAAKHEVAVATAPSVPNPANENVAKPAGSLLVVPFSEAAAKTAQQALAQHLQTSVEVTDPLGIKLVLIPPGEFLMGAAAGEKATDEEKPQHKVRITRGFRLSALNHPRTIREVSPGIRLQNAGRATADRRPPHRRSWRTALRLDLQLAEPRIQTGRHRHPVVVVSWHDADAFCEWLTAKTGETYRLPTEAEWEYACRAGTTTRWYCGDDPEGLVKVANVRDASWGRKFGPAQITGDDGFVFTAPVGSYRPNAFGLYDMHGNVFEFVHDWGGAGHYKHSPVDDPPGPDHGTVRISRSGAIDTIRSTPSAAREHRRSVRSLFQPRLPGRPRFERQEDKERKSSREFGEWPVGGALRRSHCQISTKRCAKRWASRCKSKNSIGMKFLLIPPGEFQMGSAESHSETYSSPVHKVRITNPFYLGIYEVTRPSTSG